MNGFRRLLATSLVLLLMLASGRAEAQQRAYGPEDWDTRFLFDIAGREAVGRVDVAASRVTLDFASPGRTSLDVTLNMRSIEGRRRFVTNALRGESLLAVDRFDRGTFISRKVTASGGGLRVAGDLTLRGVTRPITLTARQVTLAGDSRKAVQFTGGFARRDFDISGYPKLVEDAVRLDIRLFLDSP